MESSLAPLAPRVWIGHFHWIDITVSRSVNNEAVLFNKIDLQSPTKFVQYETGNSSLTSPPRPSATKKEVENSVFARRDLKYDEYTLLSVDIHSKKRRKTNHFLPQTSSVKSTPSSFGRPVSNPYWKFFIRNADNIIKIVREMNDHGKLCGGKIYFRRNDVTTKRFTMTFKCTCSLEKRCHKWENGIFKWQSCNVIRI